MHACGSPTTIVFVGDECRTSFRLPPPPRSKRSTDFHHYRVGNLRPKYDVKARKIRHNIYVECIYLSTARSVYDDAVTSIGRVSSRARRSGRRTVNAVVVVAGSNAHRRRRIRRGELCCSCDGRSVRSIYRGRVGGKPIFACTLRNIHAHGRVCGRLCARVRPGTGSVRWTRYGIC